jgi:hypothetical protein
MQTLSLSLLVQLAPTMRSTLRALPSQSRISQQQPARPMSGGYGDDHGHGGKPQSNWDVYNTLIMMGLVAVTLAVHGIDG